MDYIHSNKRLGCLLSACTALISYATIFANEFSYTVLTLIGKYAGPVTRPTIARICTYNCNVFKCGMMNILPMSQLPQRISYCVTHGLLLAQKGCDMAPSDLTELGTVETLV